MGSHTVSSIELLAGTPFRFNSTSQFTGAKQDMARAMAQGSFAASTEGPGLLSIPVSNMVAHNHL